MLVALDQYGEMLILTRSITEAALQQLRKKNVYCPQCKETLIIKAGAIKIPHFAHRSKSECIHQFAEGESAMHLLGKSQLFEHFSQQYETQLEPYLPTLKQRPDLLIQKNHTYAIEFQCSRLDSSVFQRRHLGYKQHGIIPIWLVKTPSFAHPEGQVLKASFNEFLKQFIQQGTLVTYHPEKAQFIYFSSLLYLQGNSFLYIARTLPLCKQIFPFYKVKSMTHHQFQQLFKAYREYRQQFLHSRLFYSGKGVNDLFLRAIYEFQLNREQLPAHIGVPIDGAEALPIFSAEWQLLLFYFMHQHQIPWVRLNDQAQQYFLGWAKLPQTEEALRVVRRYSEWLKRLKIEHVYMDCDLLHVTHTLYDDFVAIKSKD